MNCAPPRLGQSQEPTCMHECMLNDSVKEAANLVVKNTSSRTRHTGCPTGQILAPSLTSLDKLTSQSLYCLI